MDEIFIHAKNLAYSYESTDGEAIPVLKDVSFDIKKGEYVAILGHNGSGKSTLAELLNAILIPDAGELTVAGKDLTSETLSEGDIYDLRRSVGMVFQNPDNQLVATIVEDDVAFGPENLGVPTKELRHRVDEALAAVGMTQYAKHEPHRLSGGQKQRVAIAGILAMRPECMIFDESTAMLDPVGRREVVETFEKLHREQGITIITITHYMSEAARADRIIVLDGGRVLMNGTPREVFARPEMLAAVGLDVPQCSSLIHQLRACGVAINGEPMNVEECAQLILAALKEKTDGSHLT